MTPTATAKPTIASCSTAASATATRTAWSTASCSASTAGCTAVTATPTTRSCAARTALCGLSYYDADQFPAEYRGRMVLGDVVNNCINLFDIDRQGGTYTARQHKDDFLRSDDPWFRPVDIKLGPDGALYVADFYNRIIGHYEVPLDHPGRDRTSGRIWRIVYTGADGRAPPPKAPRPDWTTATADDWVKDLSHPN